MQLIADLHFHSKYSRAVSPQMVLPEIARWARIKGIDLMTTTDFTHPLWFRQLKAGLEEVGEGVYKLKGQEKPLFIFTTEISSIYTQGGKLRRIHNLVFAPNLEEAEKIGQELARRGNVMSDGRPIFGLSARDLADIIFNVSPEALVIPAHAWTPHFSLYGSQSGFDSLEECFGNMSKNIYAIETGLSSDPAMNWRVGELANKSIISCSDAHSGPKLGREATVFEIPDKKLLSYQAIKQAIQQSSNLAIEQSPHIAYTIEFYPEEGKYHYTGHRNCGVRHSPKETKKVGETCPVCGRHLTVGVMHRVEQLGQTTYNPPVGEAGIQHRVDEQGVRWIEHPQKNRPPYAMLVPLLEILAESMESTVNSQKVINEYKNLTEKFGGEFNVLLKTEVTEIAKIAGPRAAEGIKKVRSGDIVVEPGYDGVFGKVLIWPSFAKASEGKPFGVSDSDKEQMALF